MAGSCHCGGSEETQRGVALQVCCSEFRETTKYLLLVAGELGSGRKQEYLNR